MCLTLLSRYTLKKQLIIIFMLLTIFCLIITDLTAIIYLIIVSNEFKTIVTNVLIQNTREIVQEVMKGSVKILDNKIKGLCDNFLNIYTYSIEDTRRIDFPFNINTSNYKWKDTLAQPIIYNSIYESYISYENGAYSIANKLPEDVSIFSQKLNDTIYRTESAHLGMKIRYNTDNEFLSGYICLTETGLYREYPGISNGNLTDLANYDCRNEEWYKIGLNSTKKVKYTSLYVNKSFKKKIITIITAIHDVYTGKQIGVSGNDIQINLLHSLIEIDDCLINCRNILFDNTNHNGDVLMDSIIVNITENNLDIINYKKLDSLMIFDDKYNDMVGNKSDVTFVELPKYYVISYPLKINSNYMISSFIEKNNINIASRDINYNIEILIRNVIIIITMIFIIVLLITIGLVRYLTLKIIGPLQKLIDDSNKIIENIGKKDLLTGIDVIDDDINEISFETKEIQNKFKKMIEKYAKETTSKNNDVIINKYYYANKVNR